MKTGPENIAKRMRAIEPFRVMALLARARELEAQGRDIVHMEIGEPDFPTPQPVLDAATKAIAEGNIHYTPATGLPALRETIADFYKQRYAVDIVAERIIVTPGASGALLLTLGVLVDPDKKVLMADPGYPCNRNFLHFLNARSNSIAVDASTDYQLTAKHIEQNLDEDTSAVLVASPSNPTGTVIPQQELQKIIERVKKANGHVIVDEIYHGLIYDGTDETALSLSDDIFVINSFSKYFGMTGWRIGWLVAPEAYVADLDKLAQNLFLAAPTTAQYAALAAFDADNMAVLEQRKKIFRERRDYLLPALREIGFDISTTPQGAFYLYADCSRFTRDSFTFSQTLLEEIGVAITPGNDFGNNQPDTHLRFSYTTSMEHLQEGVRRLSEYLK